MPVPISRGSRRKMVHQLNRSWMVAAEKPSLYSSRLLRLVRDIMVEVTEVPTLLPMMTGIPSLRVIMPLAAMATMTEEVAEEDWRVQMSDQV